MTNGTPTRSVGCIPRHVFALLCALCALCGHSSSPPLPPFRCPQIPLPFSLFSAVSAAIPPSRPLPPFRCPQIPLPSNSVALEFRCPQIPLPFSALSVSVPLLPASSHSAVGILNLDSTAREVALFGPGAWRRPGPRRMGSAGPGRWLEMPGRSTRLWIRTHRCQHEAMTSRTPMRREPWGQPYCERWRATCHLRATGKRPMWAGSHGSYVRRG